jgi:trigger factor
MAENETAVAEQQTEEFQYQVKIEEAGPGAKKVSIEIPEQRIQTKLEEQFKELRREAAIPGFRPGHAPQKLVEKRFSNDVREQVRRSLIGESYEQAVKKHSLQVIGEPEFDNPDAIKLPETGNLTYTFQIEVQPEINLPQLSALKVRKPKVEVKEEHIDQALANLQEQQGALVPVEDRGVESKDYLIADVHVKVDGNVVSHQHDAQIVARPGRISGIQIDDLDTQLAGLKPGEKRDINVKVPDTHPNEQVKGKDVVIEVALKDIKKLELAQINDEFLKGLGFDTVADLREALKEQMLERVQYDVQQSMREQVNNYLLENIQIELPAKLSDKQAERVVQRRMIDLLTRGVSQEDVISRSESLRNAAKDEAAKELKLFFILQKVATEQNVDVNEGELNGRIAQIAAQQGKRPEKVKQEMSADGSLSNLFVQMREQKAIDKILETAHVEEVDVQPKDKE